ncbi:MAG: pantoate--beta-alanine ligase [Deltaproteobacteria bacterium]|nr:pantoate--beta-alanine ligase [Deltaproteobacteria bacterium]
MAAKKSASKSTRKPRAKNAKPKKAAKKRPVKKAAKKAAKKKTKASSSSSSLPLVGRETVVLRTASEVQARMMRARAEGLTIGFVPTMGALHSGHAALIDEARRRADVVVVSVFVNPKQFGPAEDLTKYPRPLEADVALCARCGVDVVFAPGVDEVYPLGFDTKIVAGSAASDLEGATRPGHFDGVLTVVALLFSIVQPHFGVFGEKDFQQLLLVRRLAKDLRLTTEIVAMPVIRDVDGLALSSRNVFLSPADRARAVCLSRGLVAAQDAVQRGETDAHAIAAAARAEVEGTAGAEAIYVEVRDARTLQAIDRVERDARLLLAVKVGGVRLIDNGPLFHAVRWAGDRRG